MFYFKMVTGCSTLVQFQAVYTVFVFNYKINLSNSLLDFGLDLDYDKE